MKLRVEPSIMLVGLVAALAACTGQGRPTGSDATGAASPAGTHGWTYEHALSAAIENRDPSICARIDQSWKCHGDDVAPCDPASAREFCRLELAAETGDVGYCQKLARAQPIGGLSDHDICVRGAAYRSHDPKLCRLIDSPDLVQVCLYEFAPAVTSAIASREPSQCLHLAPDPHDVKPSDRDQCYRGIASADPSLCDRLEAKADREQCRKAVGP